jgi:hypothetical protein
MKQSISFILNMFFTAIIVSAQYKVIPNMPFRLLIQLSYFPIKDLNKIQGIDKLNELIKK